ncbi:uncharacterized protein L201_007561 [Kwoniella dendrophila CBS 6074]|uniref:C2H2-type domain-containing protein n=1 Tax=Kwoniella dendrophila CBS 6074 TaxID=1295534 RepID=A0AAX4K4W8_9TREE
MVLLECPLCSAILDSTDSLDQHLDEEHHDDTSIKKRLGIDRPFMELNPGHIPLILFPVVLVSPGTVFIPSDHPCNIVPQDEDLAQPTFGDGEDRSRASAPSGSGPATHYCGDDDIIPRMSPSTAPLRLRGGCPDVDDVYEPLPSSSRPASHPITATCPLCNEDLTASHDFAGHVRRDHQGMEVTPAQAARYGCVVCQCGAVLKGRGFAQHQKSCAIGRILSQPVQSTPNRHVHQNETPVNTSAGQHSPSRSSPTAGPAPPNRPATPPPDSNSDQPQPTPQQKYFSLTNLPGRFRRLPPGVVKPFTTAAGNAAGTYIDNPSEENLVNFMSLVKVALVPGLRNKCSGWSLSSFPNVDFPTPHATENVSRHPAVQATRLIETGRPGAAMRALENESPIADPTPDTLNALRQLHPTDDSPGAIDRTFPVRRIEPPDEDDIRAALRTFKKDTSPGISGWTWNLLNLAFKDPRVPHLFDNSELGLKINRLKSKTVSIADIRLHGFKLLGSIVGPEKAQLDGVTVEVKEFRAKCDLLQQLPSQHANILFNTCILPKLYHLLRLTSPDACRAAWVETDTVVRQVVSWLRWSTGREDVDSVLISLPTRLGGLGFTSFLDASPLAFAASVELSDKVLSKFVPGVTALDQITSQKERLTKFHEDQHIALCTRLSDLDRSVVLQAGSLAGRRWLSSYPSNWTYSLTDAQFAFALRHRTLTPLETSTCAQCNKRGINFYHDENCKELKGYRTRRHESLKYALANALDTTPNCDVEIEPLILNRDPGSVRRNDIRYSGSVEAGLGPMEFDVKVTGLSTGQYVPRETDRYFNSDPIKQTTESNERALLKAWQAKVDSLERVNALVVAQARFHPVIFSSGGLSDSKTSHTLSRVKEKLIPGVYSHMLQVISCGLARSRAKARMKVEGVTARRGGFLKYALANALDTTPNCDVEIEPLILNRDPGSVRRNDIRYSGSVEAGLGPMEFDVKVTGLSTGQYVPRETDRYFNSDPIKQTTESNERALLKAWQAKVDSLERVNALVVAQARFHPVIFSSGGLSDSKTSHTLSRVKEKLIPGVYSHMLQVISCGLARSRAKARMKVEGVTARRGGL